MAKYIERIRTNEGDLQIDYNALANIPVKVDWDEDINETFTINYTEGEVACHDSESKPLGLVAENDYKLLFKMYEGEELSYEEEINVKADGEFLGTIYINEQISNKTLNIAYIEIEDSTLAAMATGESLGVSYVSVYLEDDTIPFDKIEVTITGKGKHPTVTFLPGYYIKEESIGYGHLSRSIVASIEDDLIKRGILATNEGAEVKAEIDDNGVLVLSQTLGKED